jgi:uracil-DNA glycosylase
MTYIAREYQEHAIYPPQQDLFRALALCPLPSLRVVILGQDPYHGTGQAHGLAFSVLPSIPLPPSLKNIYKELLTDVSGSSDATLPISGDLSCLATQGVLLLNTTLTVRAGQPLSHAKKGWEQFTDHIISYISSHTTHTVFILWGASAQEKKHLIDPAKHLIIESTHPSPLSAYRGFFGSRPFSRANAYLSEHGKEPIIWEKALDSKI